MKHHIILIGKDVTSAYHGVKEFGPDFIHLLYTNETRNLAQPMFSLLPASIRHKFYLIGAYDAERIKNVCHKIHQNFSGEFAYNLSEGTKIMAFSAFSVAKKHNAFPFYITQRGEVVNLDTFERFPVHSILENEEILLLNGSKISAYDDHLSDVEIKSAKDIKRFIEEHKQEHSRIQKYFDSHCHRLLNRLPEKHTFSDQLSFAQDNGELLITLKDKILLDIPFPNGCMLYFEGRWWETLVAAKAREWSKRQTIIPEVWQSVVFHSDSERPQTKNEVDVLLNNEQKLIFIECKSGQVTQNDVYKVDAVRETYGGDISQAILASYYPVDASLHEKCRDLQIELFAPSHSSERIHYIDTLPEWLDKLAGRIHI
ncbi:hypothetical protein M2459_003210 [Parabacteroides sp. PF5-5]|uniref:Card1-like endonuclease domain-containing protein n=1 Tax=unclassified Parabacteroides TaxID=2649774 RepID=UPI002476DBE3|nr:MULTISPECIES: DUF1887 family CARF protein [unclassified Parabacteroides]MDH6306534.1 hypothetical protein [Parabacteroides sp. PH5-39]MDH6317501.1 hypothetical protein [Parabacteroides sp. PF5-13]MDH6321196.1 hypothetical protein [Parabacteroides sp. PH5-13]MDH6324928.1 hypothetical protein [Parabacteroides sp. PH5-8]MDH6328637.1 hypothetical protein [Parabacteroides sp. PH5-41]